MRVLIIEKKEVEKEECREEDKVLQIYNTILFKDGQERNFLSTPVLTQVFIVFVVLTWSAYIVYIAGLLDYGSYAFIGVIVAVIYVLISNILDNTIKTEQDIEKIGGLLVLTTIPDYTLENKRGGRRK